MPDELTTRELRIISETIHERVRRLEADIDRRIAALEHTLYNEQDGLTYGYREVRRSIKNLYGFLAWTAPIVGSLVLAACLWLASTAGGVQRIYETLRPLLPPQQHQSPKP